MSATYHCDKCGLLIGDSAALNENSTVDILVSDRETGETTNYTAVITVSGLASGSRLFPHVCKKCIYVQLKKDDVKGIL